MILGALEAGGTKMVCAIGDENGKIAEKAVFPTLEPEQTMPVLLQYFSEQHIDALGIGCFGPLELNREKPNYGDITTTPKIAWQNTPITALFSRELGVPVGIDTDVNAAAYGEAVWGAGQGASPLVYMTIGTGIGGGVYWNSQLLHGMLHPEMGHMLLRPLSVDPMPQGICPFHPSCLEGLASGPSIAARWGKPGSELDVNHPAWDLEAEYLSQMCANLILTLSPQKIILGGGVMHQEQLPAMIREKTKRLLNGYIQTDELKGNLSDYILTPGLGDEAGISGALLLARDALLSGGKTC